MGAIILMLFQSLATAFYTIFSRPLAVKLERAQFQVTGVIFTGMYVCSLPVAFLVSEVHLSDLVRWWPQLVVVSIAYGLQNGVVFWMLRYMDAALAALMSMLSIASAVVMATIFLGEGLTLQQLVGAAVIVGSIGYVLSARVNAGERRHWNIGLALSIVSAGLIGVAATGEKYLLNNMEFGSYIVWGWGMQWATIVLISLFYMPRLYRAVLKRSNAKLLSAATITRTLSALGFVAGQLIIGNLSKVVVLSGLRVILVAILGVVLLHERQFMRRKFAAAVTAAVGVAIMFW